MKSIQKLSIAEKAKLLHKLFPSEIIDFLDFTKNLSHEIINDQEEIKRVWEDQVIEHWYWNSLALSVNTIINMYGKAFYYCSKLFMKKLFKHPTYLFSVHSLKAYSERPECSTRFKQAIGLLFNVFDE